MRAIVTGGAGFIGSHISDQLIEQGAEVLVIDDLSTGNESNVNRRARLLQTDICDPQVGKAAVAFQPDVIFHLAAQINVRRSVAEPLSDARTNVEGTVSALEAARFSDAKLIFASTGGVIYGECPAPAREADPCLPVAPYGAAKLAAEGYIQTWNRLYRSQHVILRYGNVFGPRQNPHGEAGAVAIFLEKFLAGDAPTIFGDGSAVRDYIYVSDVVQANLAAYEQGKAGLVANIGSGASTSVSDLFRLCQQTAQSPTEALHAPPRPGELQESRLNISLAAEQLAWAPQVSLTEGLALTWASMHDGE